MQICFMIMLMIMTGQAFSQVDDQYLAGNAFLVKGDYITGRGKLVDGHYEKQFR